MLTGETLVESQKGISNGAASAKQTLDEANVIRDERGAGEQSSHSSAVDCMAWSCFQTPIPIALLGSEGGIADLSGHFKPCNSQFMIPGFQQMNQMLLVFQVPLPQADLPEQQNMGLIHNGLVAIPLIPVFGYSSVPGSSSVSPVLLPMPIGVSIAMETLAPPTGVSGDLTHGTLNRVTEREAEDAQRPQVPQRGGAGAGAQNPEEPHRQGNRRFQVGFQLDLLLLLKLAVVVFVFNQDGSKNRLVVLLLLAAIAYMQVSPDNHSLKK
uniref:Uncharacterized protein n=2 Tax=Physcomitrium patens TaxID=3218 RepID=A0A7I4ERH4_PHYPA